MTHECSGGQTYIVERICRGLQFTHGYTLRITCLLMVAISASCNIWNLVHISIVRLELPFYVRLALAKIHDPDELGPRVVLQVVGALAEVAVGWELFSVESRDVASHNPQQQASERAVYRKKNGLNAVFLFSSQVPNGQLIANVRAVVKRTFRAQSHRVGHSFTVSKLTARAATLRIPSLTRPP